MNRKDKQLLAEAYNNVLINEMDLDLMKWRVQHAANKLGIPLDHIDFDKISWKYQRPEFLPIKKPFSKGYDYIYLDKDGNPISDKTNTQQEEIPKPNIKQNDPQQELPIGSGEHFDVYEDDSDEDMENTVIKKPKKGNKISPIEIKKHQFMKQNESSNVFIKIFNIKPDAIWAEKADTKTANDICWKFAQEYLEMSGNEENIEDDDMISDYIMDDILSPKTTIDWKWVKQITNDFNPNDDFVIAANYLLDYHNRLKLIKKWPVSTFDIHAENVGIVNRDGVEMLVIIDF